jgi:hypothetical protein
MLKPKVIACHHAAWREPLRVGSADRQRCQAWAVRACLDHAAQRAGEEEVCVRWGVCVECVHGESTSFVSSAIFAFLRSISCKAACTPRHTAGRCAPSRAGGEIDGRDCRASNTHAHAACTAACDVALTASSEASERGRVRARFGSDRCADLEVEGELPVLALERDEPAQIGAGGHLRCAGRQAERASPARPWLSVERGVGREAAAPQNRRRRHRHRHRHAASWSSAAVREKKDPSV